MRLHLMLGMILLCIFSAAQPTRQANNSTSPTAGRQVALTCDNWLRTPTQPAYVNVGNLNITGNKISIEAVINRTSFLSNGVSTEGDIVSKHSGPPDVNYILRPTRALITTTNGFFLTPDACQIQLNKTYHIAMVYDGTTLKYYRNGFLMSQVAATGNLIQNSWSTYIGYFAPQTLNENFIGYINEVRIWNVARTQADLRTYMNGSLPTPTTQTGLLAYYTFDNLLNKQGNAAWNGTLGGSATINNTNPACTFVADSCALNVVIPGFVTSDTVCVNETVTINNTTVGGTSYFWNFCRPDLNAPPQATNLGNLGGILSQPSFMDYVFDNGNYYGFSNNYFPGKLVRLDFGASLLNVPTVTDLGNFGGIIPPGPGAEGIQVVKNEGKWYAIIVGGSPVGGTTPRIIKIEFGAAITNPSPIATNWGNIGNLAQPVDLIMFQQNGVWYGLTINSENNTITRFNFTTSFNNVPTGVNFGNIGGLSYPTGIHALSDNGIWRVFVTNGGNSTNGANSSITHLDFGNSLLNPPTGVNLGNPGAVFQQPRDITVIQTCGQVFGYVVNGITNNIVKLNFNNNLLSVPTTTSLGNIGGLSFPHSISKLFRSGSDLYAFITNINNNTITRLRFAGCTNTNIANSALQNPAPFVYTVPGTYNIDLLVDEGLATQGTVCKQITVLPLPTAATRSDTTICRGSSVQLTTISNGTSYSWSPTTGLSNAAIASPTAMPLITTTYIVTASNGRCQKSDTVVISVNNACAGISNIINSYTPVTGFLPCENKLIVEDGSAFNVGDTVLIIQMKGAVIDTSNTSAFGTVTNYGNAGNYEFNYVKSRVGNVVELKNNLTRQYTVPAGKVQLIRVPYYYSTNVSSTLTCLPWDGSKGGVLVFNVRDTLTLEADVDVTGKGFRGGEVRNSKINAFTCGLNPYYYPINTIYAAGKGESITDLDSTKNAAKGAKASAGGGGLDPNTGGGGGGNGNTGGRGGYGYADCPSYMTAQDWGLGGYSLLFNNVQNKIYLGGGGGAGHCNNGFTDLTINTNFNGGNGGGIIIISSKTIVGSNKNIVSKGNIPYELTGPGFLAHDGMGGGGAGGTVLINAQNYLSGIVANTSGARGGNMSSSTTGGRVGPGGGGGGGVLWVSQPALPANVTSTATGGTNGVILQDGNNPYGATAGLAGLSVFNLVIPVDTVPFQKNIDSVRIKDSLLNCNTFDFKGLAPVHLAPIITWQWTFGDGGTATTQNAIHQYPSTGNYLVKLVVTDANGCRDSISKTVNILGANTADFSFQLDPCNPLSVQFISHATVPISNYWSFSDGGSSLNTQSPSHIFAAPGSYVIRYTNPTGNCLDTITKVITIGTAYQNIILTGDTTICFASSKQLLTVPSNSFCWSPSTYLNNPLLANPITNTPQGIIYYFTSLVTGNNLIQNGNFTQGNTGFTSNYTYTTANTGTGQYNVGTNAGTWLGNGLLCNADHTTGTGNMLMANGATTLNSNVWSQTISVLPNTNYELSGWLAALSTQNPAVIHFAVNGIKLGTPATAASTTCQWNRFSTIWNSGSQTNINLSLINTNAQTAGNDFALDDLGFAPVFIRRDSVAIRVDTPVVRAGADTAICRTDTLRLQASGAASYNWTPTVGLSNAGISNPFAFPAATTQYIVTGTTVNGCTARDTTNVQVAPQPVISALTNDTSICRNASVQLNAGGGTTYVWQPANTLSNPNIANPVASPAAATTYVVTVTGANGCRAKDSVNVVTRPPVLFRVDPVAGTCLGDDVQLHAYGGNSYQWAPSMGLSATNINNPIATPAASTTYSVMIRESTCNDSALLSVSVNVLPLPVLSVSKSNDIDCTVGLARLAATGAATYRWGPGNSLSDSTTANPSATPSITTLYTVTGRNNNGCENVDIITVIVKFAGNGMHYLPNAFTPNGDGLNECFGVQKWGQVTNLNFAIYNRWGERVFYTTNPNICWDGRYKNELQQSGNFVYIVQAKTPCGAVDMKGSVLLIR